MIHALRDARGQGSLDVRRGKTRRLDSVALVVVRLLFASWSRSLQLILNTKRKGKRKKGRDKLASRVVIFKAIPN